MLLCLCSIYVNETVIKYTLAFSSQASINLPFLSLPHHFFYTSRLWLPVRTLYTLGHCKLLIFSPFTNILNVLILFFFRHELFKRHGSWAEKVAGGQSVKIKQVLYSIGAN